jgi:hypothetical protein
MTCIWMWGVFHCSLEGAGLLPPEPPHQSACCINANPCTHDGCEKVESGEIKLWQESAKAKAPDFLVSICSLWPQILIPEPQIAAEPSSEQFDHSLGWVPSWQFVRRAAPAPRAPASILA